MRSGAAGTLTSAHDSHSPSAAGAFTGGAPTYFLHFGSLPLVFGIMAFCYSGHAVFPSIRASMQKPEQFPSVLNVAFAIIAALCTFVGAAGYWMYGQGAADVVTFNFSAGASSCQNGHWCSTPAAQSVTACALLLMC